VKNKQLQRWALGAGILSAVAVVITIGFLGFQVMNNTNATQAQTYQLLIQEMNAYRTLMVEADMAEIVEKVVPQGWDDLDRVEQRRLFGTATINWGFYESAYFANIRGISGESEWKRFEMASYRRRMNQPYVRKPEGFNSMNDLPPDAEFVDFVETNCK